MKKLFFALMVLGLAVCLAVPALCDEAKESGRDDDYGYGMGHGYMKGDRLAVHGRGRSYLRPRAWQSMKAEQREQCKKIQAEHLMDTLELRKKLATKRIEVQTLWAQPNVDQARIEKLSDEIAELSAELSKKRGKYLLKCRQKFGDQGWRCPGKRCR